MTEFLERITPWLSIAPRCPWCSRRRRPAGVGPVKWTHPGPFHTEHFELRRCPACDVVYLFPLPTGQDLETLYRRSEQFSVPHYTDPEQVRRILEFYGTCLDQQGLLPPPYGACLEVGAGLAWVSRACKTRDPNIRTVAQDVSSECVSSCPWVDRYVVGELEQARVEGPFHLISLTHVIEHLVDPATMLARLVPWLAPEGRLFVTGPHRPKGWRPEDGIAPWQSYSYLHVPAHVSYLSRRWFERQARRLGLELLIWEDQHDDGQAFEVVLRAQTAVRAEPPEPLMLSRLWKGRARRPAPAPDRSAAELATPDPVAWLAERLVSEVQLDAKAPGEPRFTEVRTFEEYRRYRSAMGPTLAKRSALERLLCTGPMPFSYPGFDACVGAATTFLVDLQCGAARDEDGLLVPNYRERVVSARTGLNSRQRAAALAMERLLGGVALRDAAIYATEAVGPFFEFIRRRAPRAVGSEFLGDAVERGTFVNGVRHEDVTRLTFPDGGFDLAVSNDVLEHVPNYRAGLTELLRILRPGGALLFTVPFLADRYDNLLRARIGPSGIEHILPPEYHGDPLNPEKGVLCFQIFGWQLLEEMRAMGYADAGAMFVWSYLHGILGGDTALFFGRKAA